jgi:hypothetical protein
MDILTLTQLLECSDEELDAIAEQSQDAIAQARDLGDARLFEQAMQRRVHVLVARELRAGASELL